MSSPYARAKFVIESNARKQAIGDASTLEWNRIQEALDPLAPIEIFPKLLSWIRTPSGNIVFRGISQLDYRALTEVQRIELQNYWIEYYFQIVKEKLQERVKGKVC